MSNESNKPIETIFDGRIKAAIWKNSGDKGAYYTVQISKLYDDEQGNTKETNSFGKNDLLKVARLTNKAYDWIVSQ